MRTRDFWSGFVCGAAAAVGAGLLVERLRGGGASRILRLEKSIQIASPLVDVWETWNDFDTLTAMSESIQQVRTFGNRSRWMVTVNGVPVEWEAEITQIIPYQAVAWKSVSGPKHSGRVTFSSIGNDTLVHVHMNYVPPARIMRPMLSPFAGDIEGYIERILRDFKAGLEKQAGTRKVVRG
jgi:uncharacterized membrane protein